MMLSEKASAFFIENLISSSSSSSSSNSTSEESPAKKAKCKTTTKDTESASNGIANFPACDTISAFISCSSKSASSSSLSSSLSSILNSPLFNNSDNNNSSTQLYVSPVSERKDMTNESAIRSPIRCNKKKFFKSMYQHATGLDSNKEPKSFSSSNCSSPHSLTPANSPPLAQHSKPSNFSSNKRKKCDTPHRSSEPQVHKLFKSNDNHNNNNNSSNHSPSSSQLSHCSDQYDSSTMTKARIETYKGSDPVLNEIECFLETDDLWKRFHELGTEMIITKSGRRMFPPLRVSFNGANLTEKYLIAMDIVPTDSKRYRYAYHRSSWLVAGKADPPVQSRLFIHPDGPFSGEMLFKQIISFEKVKLTNNEMDKCGHIVLNSMHKYQPRVHIIKRPEDKSNMSNSSFQSLLQLSSDLSNFDYKTFVFPETSFIAVTAYQNQLITKLKIDSNPFAKGFRDSSRLSDLEKESIEQLIKDNNNNPSNPGANLSATNGDQHYPNDPPTSHQNIQQPQAAQQPPKPFGDMSSMASIFAALSNKSLMNQQQQRGINPNLLIQNFQQIAQAQALQNALQQSQHQFHPLFNMNNATNHLHHHQQQQNHDHSELLRQQQLQQTYTNSLAKFMSYCQDSYMQRLIAEKYSTNGMFPLNTNSNIVPVNSQRNARYHPYGKQQIPPSQEMSTSTKSPQRTTTTPGPSSPAFSPTAQFNENTTREDEEEDNCSNRSGSAANSPLKDFKDEASEAKISVHSPAASFSSHGSLEFGPQSNSSEAKDF